MSGQSSTKSKVLIVDDSLVVVTILERMLSDRYDVLSAGNGQEALGIIESEDNISLVISDLWMPVIDGFELLGCIKQSANPKIKSIPVIIITSNQVDSPVTSKLELLGVADIVRKPVTKEKLSETIDRVTSDVVGYGRGALYLLETQETDLFPILDNDTIKERLGKFFHHDNRGKHNHCMVLFKVFEDSFTGQATTLNIVSRVHSVLSTGIRDTDSFIRHDELEFLFLMAGSHEALKKRTQYLLKSLAPKLSENQKLFNKFYTHMSVSMFNSENMDDKDLWDLFASTQRALSDIKNSRKNAILFNNDQAAYVLKQSRRRRLRR